MTKKFFGQNFRPKWSQSQRFAEENFEPVKRSGVSFLEGPQNASDPP
jgi:hypothetical protein